MIIRDEAQRRFFSYEDGIFKNPYDKEVKVTRVAFLNTKRDYYDAILLFTEGRDEPYVFNVSVETCSNFKQTFLKVDNGLGNVA